MKNKNSGKKLNKTRLCIVVAMICVTIAIVCGFGFGYVDPKLSKPLDVDDFYSTWMSSIDDSTTINQVVMPGSHDSGCNGMMAQAMTQGHDIADQLRGGVRYFDTRVALKKDELVIFHGPIKGQSFDKVLTEHREFMDKNPSEFIVFDFQHFAGDSQSKVVDMIKSKLDMSKMLDRSKYPDVSQVDFATLRVNNINFMIVWSARSASDKQMAQDNNFYIRDDSLLSQYDGDVHRDSDEALIAQFDRYYDSYEADKMFVLQAQRTASTFFGKPSTYEKKFKSKVNEYVKNIAKDKVTLAKTNIIMRDFVVSDMDNVRLILGLNLHKNTVALEQIESFKKYVIY